MHKPRKIQKYQTTQLQHLCHSDYLGIPKKQLQISQAYLKTQWKLSQNLHKDVLLHTVNASQQGAMNMSSFSYLTKYQEKYGNKEQSFLTEQQLQQSLNEMRVLLQLIDSVADQKVDRNYKFMADFYKSEAENPPNSIQKQIELLKIASQNNLRKIELQKIQLENITKVDGQYKGDDAIIQKLEEEIKVTSRKIYELDKQVKQKELDVNKGDQALIDQVQGIENNQTYHFYNKVKHMWEYKTSQLKSLNQRGQYLDQEKQSLTYKNDEISDKLKELTKLAQKQSLEVSTNKAFLALKQKYQHLKKQKATIRRKIQLLQKNCKNTQFGISKIVQDYQTKIKQVQQKIQFNVTLNEATEKTVERLSTNKNVSEAYLKSMNNRYAETLMNSLQKPQPVKPIKPSTIFRIEKPNFKTKIRPKMNKSMDIPTQPEKNVSRVWQTKQYPSNQFMNNNSGLSVKQDKPKPRSIIKPQFTEVKSKDIKIKDQIIDDQIFDFSDEPRQKNKFRISRQSKSKQKSFQNQEDEFMFDQISPKTNSRYEKGFKSQIELPNLNQQNKITSSSKPALRLSKQKPFINKNSMNESELIEQSIIDQARSSKVSRFSRLGQKRRNQHVQISEQYMRKLQKRGNQILGI